MCSVTHCSASLCLKWCHNTTTRLLDGAEDHRETNLDEVEKDLNTRKVLIRLLTRHLHSDTHTHTHTS